MRRRSNASKVNAPCSFSGGCRAVRTPTRRAGNGPVAKGKAAVWHDTGSSDPVERRSSDDTRDDDAIARATACGGESRPLRGVVSWSSRGTCRTARNSADGMATGRARSAPRPSLATAADLRLHRKSGPRVRRLEHRLLGWWREGRHLDVGGQVGVPAHGLSGARHDGVARAPREGGRSVPQLAAGPTKDGASASTMRRSSSGSRREPRRRHPERRRGSLPRWREASTGPSPARIRTWLRPRPTGSGRRGAGKARSRPSSARDDGRARHGIPGNRGASETSTAWLHMPRTG